MSADKKIRRIQERMIEILYEVNSTEAKKLICDILDLKEELLQEAEQRHKDKISKNTCDAIRRKRDHGKQYSAVPPYGWCYKNGSLVESETEQKIIHRIYEMIRVSSLGQTAIANKLGFERFKTRNGKQVWSPSTVAKIIKNPLVDEKFEQWDRENRGRRK